MITIGIASQDPGPGVLQRRAPTAVSSRPSGTRTARQQTHSSHHRPRRPAAAVVSSNATYTVATAAAAAAAGTHAHVPRERAVDLDPRGAGGLLAAGLHQHRRPLRRQARPPRPGPGVHRPAVPDQSSKVRGEGRTKSGPQLLPLCFSTALRSAVLPRPCCAAVSLPRCCVCCDVLRALRLTLHAGELQGTARLERLKHRSLP